MTTLDDVRAAAAAANDADRAFRRACIDALASYPLRQVAAAAGLSRQTVYNWAAEAGK